MISTIHHIFLTTFLLEEQSKGEKDFTEQFSHLYRSFGQKFRISKPTLSVSLKSIPCEINEDIQQTLIYSNYAKISWVQEVGGINTVINNTCANKE